MRIAVIAPQPFVDYRGTPMANLRLVTTLANAGHYVDIITFPFGKHLQHNGIEIYRCRNLPMIRSVKIGFSPAKIVLDVNLSLLSLKLAKTRNYDCVHGVEEGAFIGLWLSKMMKVPLVYDMDSIMSHELKYSFPGKFPPVIKIASFAEKRLIKESSLVMTISDSMAEFVRSIDSSKPVVAVPDIPMTMNDREPDPCLARSQIQSDKAKKFVVYTGSLAKYQGLDMLVRAMKKVETRHPDAVLVIVGGEIKEIDKLRNFGGFNVVFLGKKSPVEVMDFLAMADVLVSPRRGGINPPAKIYTYMQSGKPIIATDISAHTSVLGNDGAILVEPSVDGIGNGLLRFFENPEKAFQIAEKCKERIKEITPELQASRILEGYELVTRMIKK